MIRQQRTISDFVTVKKKGTALSSKVSATGKASLCNETPDKTVPVDDVRANKRPRTSAAFSLQLPVNVDAKDHTTSIELSSVAGIPDETKVVVTLTSAASPPKEILRTPVKGRQEGSIVRAEESVPTPTRQDSPASLRKRRVQVVVAEAEDVSMPSLVGSSPATPKFGTLACPITPTTKSLKTVTSPLSATSKPTHVKYKHLVEPGVVLPLPKKYELLERFFHALEHTIIFAKSRDQSPILCRMQKPIENMVNRTLELSHLAQIVRVYPEAYQIKPIRIDYQGVKVESLVIDIPRSRTLATSPRESTVDQNAWKPRREILHNRLLDLVKTEHAKLLLKLKFTLKYDPMEVATWHPRFDLESIPDIPQAILPFFPKRELMTLEEMLEARAKSKNKPIVESSSPLAEPTTPTPRQTRKSTSPPPCSSSLPLSETVPVSVPAKPLSRSAALLERIREKEKKKLEQSLFKKVQTPEEEKRRMRLSRLPDVVRCLFVLYVTSQKNVLPLMTVSKHVADGSKAGLSEDEAREHLKLLASVLPDVCKVVGVQSNLLRVNVEVKMNDIKPRLDALMAAERS
ncbi:hypothetical protein SeMB42_g01927 [Synchytrium endobioticum]|uniref:CDT1 Geminin-binding domain-containing protein n=1 Tax=Synchytrium endobioticum TaxID=286115 RepID=A0A507DIT5_9FUNG|nr:hypothetical protein SeLEV6574_g01918 [Synchytrium endobioticum]TPX51436.1 hypothetical protein SeMB42_g01927 [Synchytrium endobioticum]